ncbi:hypothetical protein TSAR_009650 [Trichomalopsis sarcophagae]|uniref:Fibronectin type-III domain-containing protein n=1 Tax=Trichomalopsis sarcophagae TaxID=543379 RepID=A0A232EJK2_9HYME|nr:hypothetical protein TSAR_009650 [Trichomalopsis sarcophagae]
MTMDAVKIDALPTNKSLISSKVPDTTDISKEKDDDILFVDDIDEDDDNEQIRLRLSDDEEVEQDITSRHGESQQTNLDNIINDLEFDVHIAVASKNSSKHLYKDLLNNKKSTKTQEDKTRLAEEEDSSGNSSLDERSINETIDGINEEESTMSGNDRVPPLIHNSPKYWSNNFDNRWKGANNQPRGRHSFPHRNSNDWYNKQHSHKDKFNNKNNFGNYNNHFNRVRNSTGGSYKGHSRENYDRDSRRNDGNESPKLKNKISSSEGTNHSIQENGVDNDLQSKENDSFVRNDKSTNENLKPNNKETENSEVKSDLKKNQQEPDESKTSAEEICVINNGKSDDKILKNNVEENCVTEKSADTKSNSDGALSSTQECDTSMTEVKIVTGELHKEKEDKDGKNKYSSSGTEKDMKDAENMFDVAKLVDSEVFDKTSHDNDISEKDKCENSMEVDGNNENLYSIRDENSRNSTMSTLPGNSKDIGAKDNKNTDTNIGGNLKNEIKVKDDSMKQKENGTNENSDQKLNDNANFDSDSNHSIEIPELDSKGSQVKNSNNITELMEIDGESSNSLSMTIAESRDSESNVPQPSLDNVENNFLQRSPLQTADDSHKPEKTEKSMELDKKVEDDIQTVGRDAFSSPDITDEQENLNVEEVDLADDESESATAYSKEDGNDSSQASIDITESTSSDNHKDTSLTVPITTVDKDTVDESNESGRAVVHKRRRRKRLSGIIYHEVPPSDVLTENGVRQKRRSARNAEEMIRKEIMKNDEEDEDSDEKASRMVSVQYKIKPNSTSLQPQSPSSLKRSFEDADSAIESLTLKKIRSSSEVVVTPIVKSPDKEKKELTPKSKESIAETRDLVRKISQEDIRGKLQRMTPEDMEALLIQKIVECITIRGEMGKLREQARASKRNQEATRLKCQQLQKQVEGFEMVLRRFTFDKNSNSDKYLPPIKINRSVGLQVNFLSQESGIQNLKQIAASKGAHGSNTSNVSITNPNVTTSVVSKPNPSIVQDNRLQNQSPRKMLKTRSPRRPEVGTIVHTGPVVSTATPTALVMGKPVNAEPKRTITLQNGANIVQLMPPGQQQTVVVNSTVGGPSNGGSNNRQTNLTIQRTTSATPTVTKASDLIDLTDEEDKTKTSVVTPITTINSRLPRVIHTVPSSVAITNATNLRLVQTGSPMSQTAIVSNNAPRLAYVMQGSVNGGTRQLVLTSTNPIRPVTSVPTRNISTISYKTGVPTLTNGTVRVLTTQAPTAVQVPRHPAPLPETPSPESNPLWKLPPPAPSLKISKVATGIVLSWNMTLTDKFAEIVSYQLYAYQEVTGTNPNAALWKKVGDVRALPLPMACTLTQFTEGNNYYFAVRAVDVHSRFGQYSKPGNISL